ncbi:cell wall-binding repeat-containing protein [Serinicoccus sediminis]|uniref:cell wall-binding repeat-containing protein n=1 Tax=Serinicoccus sediminis TaxID=2306021 RepID=UPI00101FD2DB|nr:cell wall-binding repeat-containing protein [Serinicoccus sediminis]
MTYRSTSAARRALAAVAGLSLVAGIAPVTASASGGPAAASASGDPASVSVTGGPAVSGPVSASGELEDGTYVVVLDELPLATHPATAGSALEKVDTTSRDALSYADRLVAQQDDVLAEVAAEPTYRYTVALNGFAARLTAAEAAALAERDDVVSVTRSRLRQLDADVVAPPDGAPAEPDVVVSPDAAPAEPDTVVSPGLLGLRGPGGVWSRLGGPMEAGRGTVVGVIDSGIAYDNPSFAADGMPAPPADWAGECETGEGDDADDFPASACTDKIVGARYFVEGARADGYEPIPAESVSPLDTDDHGSHVAGTAVGRQVQVDLGGTTSELAGMAPGAHVAAYKTCFDFQGVSGCHPEDTIAAVDAALADGVDVLNLSVSGDPETYEDPVDLAFKNAAAAGVFTATSAGNLAQRGEPVAHLGPWMTTVAASFHRTQDGPVPSVAPFSGRGPVAVAPVEQTVLKPDLGAPGVQVLAAYASEGGEPQFGYLSGTSMASPHVAGLGALLAAAHPEWSPMAVKSAMQTSARNYATTQSNRAVVGGTGFVEPRAFLEPGLVFDSTEADWDAFLADPSTGYDLNAAYVSVPALGLEPTTLTRTVTNPGPASATFTASFTGPATLSVTTSPQSVTVPAGGSAEVTITVANTGAGTAAWQEGDLRWTSGGTVVEIPVLARGQVYDEPAPRVERVSGTDRYGTAAAVSALYPDGVETVYIASGTAFADALSGSPAAAQGLLPGTVPTPEGNPAPVLLVKHDRIPQDTVEALEAVDPSNIVILGGAGAVSSGLARSLKAYGTVSRVEGGDRYETAAKLALMFEDPEVVYVASGREPSIADALAGAARAGMENAPVLLTRPDGVPTATAEALETLDPDRVVVLGGTGAVQGKTFTALGADDRLWGDDRYRTAVAVSQVFEPDVPLVYIASGRSLSDALAGSALAGHQGVPVLLTKPTQLPSATLAELERLSPQRVVVLGGYKAVSEDVQNVLDEYYPDWVAEQP